MLYSADATQYYNKNAMLKNHVIKIKYVVLLEDGLKRRNTHNM